jgi:hypothetical protein
MGSGRLRPRRSRGARRAADSGPAGGRNVNHNCRECEGVRL